MSRWQADGGAGTSALIWRLIRIYPRRTTAVVVLSLLAGVAEGAGVMTLLPVLALASEVPGEATAPMSAQILAVIESLGIEPAIGPLLLLIVLGISAKAGLLVAAQWQAGAAAAQVARDLRLDLIDALMSARWGHFTSQPTGRLANAVSGEAERASSMYTKGCQFLAAISIVLVYLAIAIALSWQIAVSATVVGLVMIVSLRALVGIARRAGSRQTVTMRSLVSRWTDGLYAIKPLKAMSREDRLRPLLAEEAEEVNRAQRRAVLSMAGVGALQEPIATLFVAALVYVLLGTVGVPFDELVFIAFVFYRTVRKAGVVQRTYQAVVVVESALSSIIESTEEARREADESTGRLMPSLEHAVTLRDVTFAYGDAVVLEGLNASIPAGELTAVIGPSGVGKTTVADLVLGLYRPQAGEVYVDDTPLGEADLRAWRSRIGYVPQETVLFHDTVFVNVGMRDPDVSREDVGRALRLAGAWDFVSQLADGLDAVIGEHGLRLSGGQRQRLSIARALVHRPDLLVLDEATSALDPETERSILETLRDLRGQVTVLAISHQPALMDVADHVLDLTAAAEPAPRGRFAAVTDGTRRVDA